MEKDDIKKTLRAKTRTLPSREKIKRISLFGSYVNSTPRKESDIDVLIEFQPGSVGFFEFIRIQQALEQAIGKKVDLTTPRALSPLFRDSVLREAEPVYERG